MDIICTADYGNSIHNSGNKRKRFCERPYSSCYFGINKSDISQDEFFQIWTTYEAEYKSNIKSGGKLISFKYDNYFVTISYNFDSNLSCREITLDNVEDLYKKYDFNKINISKSDLIAPIDIKLK